MENLLGISKGDTPTHLRNVRELSAQELEEFMTSLRNRRNAMVVVKNSKSKADKFPDKAHIDVLYSKFNKQFEATEKALSKLEGLAKEIQIIIALSGG